ncbi:MAG: hypothetical protein LBU85_10010 [Treponema sp.]|jgi:hypothetical protein|nr:hypothetical protein [Treponema sp.]
MKIRHLCFALFIAAAVFGCVSPPPEPPPPPPPPPPVRPAPPPPPPEPPPSEVALTPAILERLEKMNDYAGISNYQFVLSSQISLIIANAIPNDHSLPGGRAVFENILARNRIIFQTKSLGQALDKNEAGNEEGDEIRLRVCFEHQEDESKYPAGTYNLVFSARKSEPNAYFYLNFTPRPDTFLFSEERGSLKYGENTYTLLANEEIPYLLIRLEQKTSANEDKRSPRGRSLNTK